MSSALTSLDVTFREKSCHNVIYFCMFTGNLHNSILIFGKTFVQHRGKRRFIIFLVDD